MLSPQGICIQHQHCCILCDTPFSPTWKSFQWHRDIDGKVLLTVTYGVGSMPQTHDTLPCPAHVCCAPHTRHSAMPSTWHTVSVDKSLQNMTRMQNNVLRCVSAVSPHAKQHTTLCPAALHSMHLSMQADNRSIVTEIIGREQQALSTAVCSTFKQPTYVRAHDDKLHTELQEAQRPVSSAVHSCCGLLQLKPH